MNDLVFNPFHKKTFFPSINNSIQLNKNNNLFYTSGNKLISYDLIKGTKLFRVNLNGVRIISFLLQRESDDKVYALDSNNLFFEYDLSTKTSTSSIQLKHNYSMIRYANGKYFLYGKDMFIAMAEIVPSDKGTQIKLIDEYKITIEESQYNKSKPSEHLIPKFFDVRNEYVILSKSNILVVLNTISKKVKQIEFQKKITSGCFVRDDQLVLGDIGGKMHFISEFNQLNVSEHYYYYITLLNHFYSILYQQSTGMLIKCIH